MQPSDSSGIVPTASPQRGTAHRQAEKEREKSWQALREQLGKASPQEKPSTNRESRTAKDCAIQSPRFSAQPAGGEDRSKTRTAPNGGERSDGEIEFDVVHVLDASKASRET